MQEFHIGEVIKQRRMELGMTQEDLCEGICEQANLSRIESGRSTPSRTKLNVLLQRLSLPESRYYALMSENELEISNLQNKIVSCNIFERAEEGLEHIRRLEQITAPDDNIVQQFILRSKVILGKLENGEVKPYSFEERLEMLLQAIRLTRPNFDLDEIEKGIYGVDEVKIINQIASTYGRSGNRRKCLEIYHQLLRYLKKKEITEQSKVLLPMVSHNYAIRLSLDGRYEEAIEIAEYGRKACVSRGHYQYLPGTLAIMAECYHFLQKDELSEKLYYQAYYLYEAIENTDDQQIIKEEMKKYLNIEPKF